MRQRKFIVKSVVRIGVKNPMNSWDEHVIVSAAGRETPDEVKTSGDQVVDALVSSKGVINADAETVRRADIVDVRTVVANETTAAAGRNIREVTLRAVMTSVHEISTVRIPVVVARMSRG